MMPQNAALAARLLYKTVDAIWYAIGDRSTDFNFYTKRGLLAGVYSATLFYWLNDKSEGGQATWTFLDRRIGFLDICQTVEEALARTGAAQPRSIAEVIDIDRAARALARDLMRELAA